MAAPYAETMSVLESHGRVFVDGKRFTADDYRRMRRGLDAAIAFIEDRRSGSVARPSANRGFLSVRRVRRGRS